MKEGNRGAEYFISKGKGGGMLQEFSARSKMEGANLIKRERREEEKAWKMSRCQTGNLESDFCGSQSRLFFWHASVESDRYKDKEESFGSLALLKKERRKVEEGQKGTFAPSSSVCVRSLSRHKASLGGDRKNENLTMFFPHCKNTAMKHHPKHILLAPTVVSFPMFGETRAC